MSQDWGGSEVCVVCGAPVEPLEAHVSLTLSVEYGVPAEESKPTMKVLSARELAVCCRKDGCVDRLESALRSALL